MSYTVAVDPGKHVFGLAAFRNTELLWAILLERSAVKYWLDDSDLPRFDAIVIEKPHRQQRTVSVNDIVEVAIAAGEAGARLQQFSGGTLKYVRPDEWGGQTPKPIKNKRAKAALLPMERTRVVMPSAEKTLGHNIWDSVGLGLWAVGRVKRSWR